MLTHQHIDHLGLVDIIASHSGADVAAIDKLVHFVEHYSEDAGKDDEFASRGDAAKRHSRGDRAGAADRVVRVSQLGREREGHAAAARRRAARAARPLAAGAAPSRPQPIRHGLLGRGAQDPDRRRPPDQAHLLQPADLAAARPSRTTRPGGGRRRAAARARHLHRARCGRRASCRPRSCSPVTASRSPTTSR